VNRIAFPGATSRRSSAIAESFLSAVSTSQDVPKNQISCTDSFSIEPSGNTLELKPKPRQSLEEHLTRTDDRELAANIDVRSVDVKSLRSAFESNLETFTTVEEEADKDVDEDDDCASVRSLRGRFEKPPQKEVTESSIAKLRSLFETKKPAITKKCQSHRVNEVRTKFEQRAEEVCRSRSQLQGSSNSNERRMTSYVIDKPAKNLTLDGSVATLAGTTKPVNPSDANVCKGTNRETLSRTEPVDRGEILRVPLETTTNAKMLTKEDKTAMTTNRMQSEVLVSCEQTTAQLAAVIESSVQAKALSLRDRINIFSNDTVTSPVGSTPPNLHTDYNRVLGFWSKTRKKSLPESKQNPVKSQEIPSESLDLLTVLPRNGCRPESASDGMISTSTTSKSGNTDENSSAVRHTNQNEIGALRDTSDNVCLGDAIAESTNTSITNNANESFKKPIKSTLSNTSNKTAPAEKTSSDKKFNRIGGSEKKPESKGTTLTPIAKSSAGHAESKRTMLTPIAKSSDGHVCASSVDCNHDVTSRELRKGNDYASWSKVCGRNKNTRNITENDLTRFQSNRSNETVSASTNMLKQSVEDASQYTDTPTVVAAAIHEKVTFSPKSNLVSISSTTEADRESAAQAGDVRIFKPVARKADTKIRATSVHPKTLVSRENIFVEEKLISQNLSDQSKLATSSRTRSERSLPVSNESIGYSLPLGLKMGSPQSDFATRKNRTPLESTSITGSSQQIFRLGSQPTLIEARIGLTSAVTAVSENQDKNAVRKRPSLPPPTIHDDATDNESEFSDGVTLDVSIADVSNLTNPTVIWSKNNDRSVSSHGEDYYSDPRSIELNESKRSEASSSHTSEAAHPLFAKALRLLPKSDEYSNDSFFKTRSLLARHWGNPSVLQIPSNQSPSRPDDEDEKREDDYRCGGWDASRIEALFPFTTEKIVIEQSNVEADWNPFSFPTWSPCEEVGKPVAVDCLHKGTKHLEEKVPKSGLVQNKTIKSRHVNQTSSSSAFSEKATAVITETSLVPTINRPKDSDHGGNIKQINIESCKLPRNGSGRALLMQRLSKLKASRLRRAAALQSFKPRLFSSDIQESTAEDCSLLSSCSSTHFGGSSFQAALDLD
jgi:hypothetical protein